MQRLHVDRQRRGNRSRFRPKDTGGTFQELGTPLRNLIGMHIKLLCQLGKCLLAAHRSERHLRLEGRVVVPPGSLCHRLS